MNRLAKKYVFLWQKGLNTRRFIRNIDQMQKTRRFLKKILTILLLVFGSGCLPLACHTAFAYVSQDESLWPVMVDHFDLPKDLDNRDVQTQIAVLDQNGQVDTSTQAQRIVTALHAQLN